VLVAELRAKGDVVFAGFVEQKVVHGVCFTLLRWILCQCRWGRNDQMAGSSSPSTQEQKP
jgi:hypothetical protein